MGIEQTYTIHKKVCEVAWYSFRCVHAKSDIMGFKEKKKKLEITNMRS